jgi:hypothetical protein
LGKYGIARHKGNDLDWRAVVVVRRGKRMKYKSRLIRNRAARPQLPNGTSAEPRQITQREVHSREMEFRLDRGRLVLVQEIRIISSTQIAGSKDAIRDDVVKRYPKSVREQFPGRAAYFVRPIPEGELPAFIFMVALVCYQPTSDATADFFDLVVSWSSDDLDSSLPKLIEREIRDIEWDWMARPKGRSTAGQP